MDLINELEYTEFFLKEVFRLYPPVPEFGRIVSKDCKIGSYRIFVILWIYSTFNNK